MIVLLCARYYTVPSIMNIHSFTNGLPLLFFVLLGNHFFGSIKDHIHELIKSDYDALNGHYIRSVEAHGNFCSMLQVPENDILKNLKTYYSQTYLSGIIMWHVMW